MPAIPPPKRHPYNQWAPDARALDLVGDKWTLLIVRDLAGGPRRFVELQRVLPGISTEQLRSRLNRMVADGLLTRQRYREVPPRVDYELTERARDLLPVVGALAPLGLPLGLGPAAPRRGDRHRRDPALRPGPRTCRRRRAARVELAVEARRRRRAHLRPARGRRHASRTRSARAPEADAHVLGPERAWVEAFGLDGSRTELEIEGDAPPGRGAARRASSPAPSRNRAVA